MNIIAGRIGAILVIAGLTIYPQISNAEGFTGEDFAKWSEDSQNSYIQTSVMMAGVIGTRIRPEISGCIDNWYFSDIGSKAERNRYIRQTIAQYGEYHPSGVILAILQETCGKFD